jgi:hypothetical protein
VGSLADEVAVLMCEAEAAIGARSHVLPEVEAAPGVSAVFWLLFVSVAPPVAEQALRPCLRAPSAQAPRRPPGPTY